MFAAQYAMWSLPCPHLVMLEIRFPMIYFIFHANAAHKISFDFSSKDPFILRAEKHINLSSSMKLTVDYSILSKFEPEMGTILMKKLIYLPRGMQPGSKFGSLEHWNDM